MKKGLIIALAVVLVLGLSGIGMAATVTTPVITPHVSDVTVSIGDVLFGSTAWNVTSGETHINKDAFAFTWNGLASVYTASTDLGGSDQNFQSGLYSEAIGTYAHAQLDQKYKTHTGAAFGDWWRSPWYTTGTSAMVKEGDVYSGVWTDTGILTFPVGLPTAGIDEYKFANASAGSSSGWSSSMAGFDRSKIVEEGGSYPDYQIYEVYYADAETSQTYW